MFNCIYKISSYRNGRVYVGSAINSIKRKSLHFKTLERGTHHNIKLQRHYNKYGVCDLSFEIIESNIAKEDLVKMEQYYLDKLKPSFNICLMAGSVIGRKQSVATKIKISNSLMGIKHTLERRANISASTRGKNKKPFTVAHRMNMSIAKRGKKTHSIHKRKPIFQLIDGEVIAEYNSIKEAMDKIKISKPTIHNALKNNTKAKGYEFKYK